ncbi:MAG: DUF2617 family protein [Deltaproteobacteria bacterium]|nr:DUF2617 family protein [Deltaproteobacteria bacterium]
MKKAPQKNSGIHSASELKLLLHNGTIENIPFKTFHNIELVEKNWYIQIDIIGESHKIKIANGKESSSINEVLACMALDKNLSPSCYMERLSHIKTGKLERRVGALNYRFRFEQIGFGEKKYRDALASLAAGGDKCISYDFANGRKDSLHDIYGPVTLVKADITGKSVNWASLHIYPNDEVAIISESSISKEKGKK